MKNMKATKTMPTPLPYLGELDAFSEAVAWVRESKCRSLETAWKKCERGDWMLDTRWTP